MSDRYPAETNRPLPNPHDTAKAVFRPMVLEEAIDWLRETNPGLFNQNAGFRVALDKLAALVEQTSAVPSARLLDHATAAYYRQAAASLDNAGHYGTATLLRHVADDYDGHTEFTKGT
jgi:hypothetical protein